jgi:hypothetical protein
MVIGASNPPAEFAFGLDCDAPLEMVRHPVSAARPISMSQDSHLSPDLRHRQSFYARLLVRVHQAG